MLVLYGIRRRFSTILDDLGLSLALHRHFPASSEIFKFKDRAHSVSSGLHFFSKKSAGNVKSRLNAPDDSETFENG